METPIMKLVCGTYEVEVHTPLEFSRTALGCSRIKSKDTIEDLFDLGFRHTELLKHGLKVYVGGFLIVDFPAE